MADITIPIPKTHGSSGSGLSSLRPLLGCARRGYLEREVGTKNKTHDDLGERKTDRYGKPVLDRAKVGILFASLEEHYHGHDKCQCSFAYEDGPTDLEWTEALRLFATYRKEVPAWIFGKILTVEEAFAVGCDDPLNCAHADAGGTCSEAFEATFRLGVPYFTGRLDRKSVVDSPKVVDYWAKNGGWGLEEGDILFIDSKTKKQEDSTLVLEAMERDQFMAYMMVGEWLGGQMNAKALIGNYVISTKEVKCRQVYVPKPSTAQKAVLRSELALAWTMRSIFGDQLANPTRCLDYHQECPFYNRECDRTNDADKLLDLARWVSENRS